MILSGLLSTMNMWVDTYEDIRFSLNDVYMILLMTGWMFLFMGIYYKEINPFVTGFLLVTINLWCIRNQFMISSEQYALGMIPHHSMAIHMSKALLKKQTDLNEFATSIIEGQRKEIDFMKKKIF
jgi:hypothetical protein